MSGTSPSPASPASPASSLSCWLLRSRRSPGEARRILERLLADAPGGERFLGAGRLLVTELVTNAVVHGAPIGRRVRLVLHVDRRRLRIEVQMRVGSAVPCSAPPAGRTSRGGASCWSSSLPAAEPAPASGECAA
ncbi:ATP-binding protein [Streptomyces sp. BE20]|uniref:ATP-binding protein n=1 Tax=Streptomyces sp. BE20 TaxID=3002525 RepID=UPI002E7760C9|nr:ATP-binding protein [Streptomyces sp. BE20]MEE1823344.1 ATP-binding protein [Streptomyces sp. BE20]